MDNTVFGLIAIGCIILLLPIAAAAVKYGIEYSKNVRYLQSEINRSCDREEYIYWKTELRDFRWSILPGLTPGRVKRIRRFFRRGKHRHKK